MVSRLHQGISDGSIAKLSKARHRYWVLAKRLAPFVVSSLGSFVFCQRHPRAFTATASVLTLSLYGRMLNRLRSGKQSTESVAKAWMAANLAFQTSITGIGSAIVYHQLVKLIDHVAQRKLREGALAFTILSLVFRAVLQTNHQHIVRWIRCCDDWSQNWKQLDRHIRTIRSAYCHEKNEQSYLQQVRDVLFMEHCLENPQLAAATYTSRAGYRRFKVLCERTRDAVLKLVSSQGLQRMIKCSLSDLEKNQADYILPGSDQRKLNAEACESFFLLTEMFSHVDEKRCQEHAGALGDLIVRLTIRGALGQLELRRLQQDPKLSFLLTNNTKKRYCGYLAQHIKECLERLCYHRENGYAMGSTELSPILAQIQRAYDWLTSIQGDKHAPESFMAMFDVIESLMQAVQISSLDPRSFRSILYSKINNRNITVSFIKTQIEQAETELKDNKRSHLHYWRRFVRLLQQLNTHGIILEEFANECRAATAKLEQMLGEMGQGFSFRLPQHLNAPSPLASSNPLARSDAWEFLQDSGIPLEEAEQLAKAIGVHSFDEEEIQFSLRRLGLRTATDVKDKVCRGQRILSRAWLIEQLNVYVKLGGRNNLWGYAQYGVYKLSSIFLNILPAIHRWRSALLGAGLGLAWELGRHHWTWLRSQEEQICNRVESSRSFSWLSDSFKRRHVHCFEKERWFKTALFFRSDAFSSWQQVNKDLTQTAGLIISNTPHIPPYLQPGALMQGFCLGRDFCKLLGRLIVLNGSKG